MSNKYSSQGLLSVYEAQGGWLQGNLLVSTFPLGSTQRNSFLPVGLSSHGPFHTAGIPLLRAMSTGLSIPTPGSQSTQIISMILQSLRLPLLLASRPYLKCKYTLKEAMHHYCA